MGQISAYERAKLQDTEWNYINDYTHRLVWVWRGDAPELLAIAKRIGMTIIEKTEAAEAYYIRFTPESYAMWQLVRSEYENPEV